MTTWTRAALGDLVEEAGGEIKTGPFGSQLHESDYVDDPTSVVVVMPKDMVGGSINYDTAARISQSKAAELSQHITQLGDVLIPRRGDLTRQVLIREPDVGSFCGTGSLRIRLGAGRLSPGFLLYYLQAEAGYRQLESKASGVTMPNISTASVREVEVVFPDKMGQAVITSIVAAYDELIENNLRRIEILEAMAQAIFREWFVDFRFPGHQEIELIESEVGEIPRGWDVLPLGEYAAMLIDGDWIETKDQGGRDFRLLQVSNVGLGSYRDTGNFRYITTETFERLRCTEVSVGDILISRMPDPIGRAWLVDHLDEPAITAVDVAILTPPTSAAGLYLSMWLNQPRTLAHADALATGTTRKRISRSVLSKMVLPVPPLELLKQFAAEISPVRALTTILQRQNANLRATRDLLLPKLISGEIDVAELDIDTSWHAA